MPSLWLQRKERKCFSIEHEATGGPIGAEGYAQGMVRLACRYSTLGFSSTAGNSLPMYLVVSSQLSDTGCAQWERKSIDVRGWRSNRELVDYSQKLL